MERLMNVEVKFAKHKMDGEGEYGPWSLWNFTLTDPDWDGIWFSSFKEPRVGMKIDVLEYEIEEKGEFINYRAKKLIEAEGKTAPSNPKPKPQTKGSARATPAPNGNGGQAYINHGEVVCKLLAMASSPAGEIDRPVYEKLLNAFKWGIRVLTTETTPAPKPKSKPEPEELQNEDQPYNPMDEENGIPF